MKKRIENLTLFMALLFAILAVYVSNLQIINCDAYTKSKNNPRILENIEFRGKILDRRGEPLALTRREKTVAKRVYPKHSLFSPIIGYVHNRLGKEGLEKYLNDRLSGKRFPQDFYEALAFINGKKLTGQDVYLTLDSRIQKAATEAMKGYTGAMVVINPQTGEVLALVSSPGYDPNEMEASWEKLRKDPYSPLMNRAIDGRYPPGSTFKIFTLAVALQLGYVNSGTGYQCPGYYDIGEYKIHEAEGGKHGSVTLEDALVHSCNIAFAQMGLEIGRYSFCEFAKSFKLLEPFDMGVPAGPAHFPSPSLLTEGGLAQSAFGQGEITLSPLHLAILAEAMANEGKIMKPYLVKGIRSGAGDDIFVTHPQIWAQPISRDVANKVRSMMVQVVERGTGYAARIPGVSVAGKTGTAENPHGETHAWFVGFAPAEKPQFLVAAILEKAGYGGRVAAPVVGDVLYECLITPPARRSEAEPR